MTRRIILSIAVVLSFSASTVFARVSGLPDFTGLVEDAVPAVVNIQVTQFGNRVTPDAEGAENPHDPEQMPEFFRRFFGTPGAPGNPGRDSGPAGRGLRIHHRERWLHHDQPPRGGRAPMKSSCAWPIVASSRPS